MSQLLNDQIDFAYGGFLIYDLSTPYGPNWDEAHYNQGFVRQDSYANFIALAQWGTAPLTVFDEPFRNQSYDIAIAVPFPVVTGKVAITGPEESVARRSVLLAPGSYRLTAAQKIIVPSDGYSENEIAIDLFFERVDPLPERSRIIISNPVLNPPDVLLEDASG